MFDTIAEIIPDSLSLYLKREVIAELPDPAGTGFSLVEVIPISDNRVAFDTLATMMPAEKMFHGFPGAALSGTNLLGTIFFLFFLFCLVGLSFWSNKEGAYFAANLKKLFVYDAMQRSAYKEQVTTSGIWSGVFMVFQAVLLITMILFAALVRTGAFEQMSMSGILLFSLLYFSILLLILIKYLVYRLTDYVFPEWGFSAWHEQFFSLIGMTGLLIFIPALFYIFTPEFSKETVFLLLIVFFTIMVVIFRNLLVIFVKNKIGVLNYFLYLCAIEIVPLFLLYKGVDMLI